MKRLLSICVAVAFAALACKGSDSTTPSTTTPSTSTNTFTGTVAIGGLAMHNFTATHSGQVSVTLTAAGPPSTVVMGLGIGTPGNSTCSLLPGASTTAVAGSTAQLTGVLTPATFCVAVYDVGNQTAPVTYSVTVVYP
jgi:hypothetical protein